MSVRCLPVHHAAHGEAVQVEPMKSKSKALTAYFTDGTTALKYDNNLLSI
jgi:hypothetical protein